jgi:long-chain acyl-CoA synthetase
MLYTTRHTLITAFKKHRNYKKMNTADYLIDLIEDERLALIQGENHYSYADLRLAIATIIQALRQAEVEPATRVGIYGPNSFFWIAAYLAILKLGAVAVPFSPTARPAQLAEMQALVACRVVCLQAKNLTPAVSTALGACLCITDTVLGTRTAEVQPRPARSEVEANQIAALMFTSGTTARARAVCVTHQNIQANTRSIIEALEIRPDDRMLVLLPLHYCFGTSLLHTHLRVGASLVLASNPVLPEVVLDDLEAHHCTGFAGVPSIYQTLLRRSTFAQRKLPHLRALQQAGGKLQPALIEELARLRPTTRIFIMYGQTEATARLSYLPPAQLHSKQGSIGRGMPGIELRVVADDGTEVRPGEVGQIIARGDNITAGYLDEPEATAGSFVDGVLYTGDLATVDEDGFIYIVDRQKDFIKPLGHRVSSQEIEACIMTLTEVVLAAAIGIPDPVFGEAIKVYVTLKPEHSIDSKAIIMHCMQSLPRYMVPREVVILDDLPMNAQGKVLKAVLRQMA